MERRVVRYGLILPILLTTGCMTMGRATQGRVPDVEKVHFEPGKTTRAQVLADLGLPDEWHATAQGNLLIWRHRKHHFGRYGIEIPGVVNLGPQSIVMQAVTDNLRFTYERIQQAEVRVAVLFDRDGRVLAASHHDGRERLTTF
jgi:hypothetical protein